MAVKNEARIKTPLTVGIREQLEHRALWMYLLIDEAKKKVLIQKSMYLKQSSVVDICMAKSIEKLRVAEKA